MQANIEVVVSEFDFDQQVHLTIIISFAKSGTPGVGATWFNKPVEMVSNAVGWEGGVGRGGGVAEGGGGDRGMGWEGGGGRGCLYVCCWTNQG